jgi:predicted metal-dependent phosphoesterase TrpH
MEGESPKPLRIHADLHVHSRFSADGIAEPEDMVREAKRKGLQAFAITDHNTCACVDYFLQHGFMREDGQPVDGLLIIPGQEITTSAGHLLALGVRLPDLKGIPPVEAIEIIHHNGGLAVPPHPYDLFRAGIRENILDVLKMDALEVFNAATTFRRCNEQAHAYAERRGLPMTAGSDAHHAEAIGVAYTVLEAETFDLKGVLAGIPKSKDRNQNYMSARDAFKKTWNNLFRWRLPSRSRRASEGL